MSLTIDLSSMFPQIGTPYTIFSGLAKAITNLLNHISKVFSVALKPCEMEQYIEEIRRLPQQMLDLVPSIEKEYYARMNLRIRLGLSPVFRADSNAIRSLSGSISWITKEKIDVTELIREMRDND